MVLCRALMRTLRFSNAPVSALKGFATHGTTNLTKAHVSRCISTCYKHFAERRYTDKHEWVSVDGNIGTIGISNYAQEALGDVVFAQLPEKGLDLSQTDECGALESVKAASELYSPVSGQVTEKNVAVESTPGLINTSCYDDGWLFRVTLTKPDEVKKLMDEKQYQEFLKSDAQHH